MRNALLSRGYTKQRIHQEFTKLKDVSQLQALKYVPPHGTSTTFQSRIASIQQQQQPKDKQKWT